MNGMKLFNDGWKFQKTGLDVTMEEVLDKYNLFTAVDVPHDWLIYHVENLYEDGCGWYLKRFYNNQDTAAGEKVLLRFDGVYMDCEIYVNRILAGEWKYGYSAFTVDLSPALTAGENEVLVRVRHQAPNSRWYSGAGIYRNVWLKECGKVYLPPDGTYVSTRANGDGYILDVETEVEGMTAEGVNCGYTLWCDRQQVLNLGRHKVSAGKSRVSSMIRNPRVWDIEDPVCYELRVELYEENQEEPADVQRVTVGFRTMEFDPEQGFLLNGRCVKVHGACEHHDFGCLGAVFSREAMRRKLRRLREMGVNGIRTSHNMPAKELMELTDEMGFLVVNEAFDMWERSKTEYDYARFFPDWAERDVASWIRRDRNHPSLMLWSIGNEIYDTHADERGQEITRNLAQWVRCHDPRENAPVTIGSNYMPWENARKCADLVKIAGYNYGEKYYEEHHKMYPDWVIYGSETASVVQSRGVYHFPLSQSMLADEDEQCSALGNSTTSWGARSIEKCIVDDRDAVFTFGQFIWTGFDYIGEPTPYHTKNSYFGQLDTAGFPKDSYYIFQAAWTDVEKQPMVHVFPYWDFNEGQLIDVRACTNGAFVELFVNGVSHGRQEIDHKKGKKLLGEWQVPYAKGMIQAVAYDKEGNPIAQEIRRSFGDGMRITLEIEEKHSMDMEERHSKEILRADGEDLCFLTIGMEDEDGNPVENAMDYVRVQVKGPGRLLGLDNGDSTDYDEYKGCCRKLFQGKLLAVIGTTDQPGDIEVLVSGEGLESAALKLVSEKAPVRQGISASENWNESIGRPKAYGLNPVRKVELRAIDGRRSNQGQLLTPEQSQVLVEARIYPLQASDKELIWKAVNDAGVEIGFAKVMEEEHSMKEELSMVEEHFMEEEHSLEDKTVGSFHTARVTAFGDGDFRVRCMSRSGSQGVKILSQLEFKAVGLGQAYLNPYEFISASLYADSFGEIGNGNEKGIATARDGASGVIYSAIDFGDYGSDEITVPVFALSGEEYPIEIWLGKPGEIDSELLTTVVYQKPSIWNVYQEETWKLPRRIKGVADIAFLLKAKVHVKGFYFRKYEKAISRLYAAECSRVYGDCFMVEKEAVTGIGNNVTLEYEDMDFGEEGVGRVIICGRTNLPVNTIHIHFTGHSGETLNHIVEFKGSTDSNVGIIDSGLGAVNYQEQCFEMEKLQGSGKVEFVFLPGSSFDFHYFQFDK